VKRLDRLHWMLIGVVLGLLALLLAVLWDESLRMGAAEAVWGDDDDATVSAPGDVEADGTCAVQQRGHWSPKR
jgi:hypothetical protein